MKQILIIVLLIAVAVIAEQLNDFELFLINQTSLHACMVGTDCD